MLCAETAKCTVVGLRHYAYTIIKLHVIVDGTRYELVRCFGRRGDFASLTYVQAQSVDGSLNPGTHPAFAVSQ